MKIAFFGTPDLAVTALSVLEQSGQLPSLIVTTPDAPVGRKQILTSPATKVWAQERSLAVFQPNTLQNKEELTPLTDQDWDLFVVFAYGKIMPEWLINLPKYGTVNAHPSLLPKLRGASPIRSTLLHDLSACGVTIIQMDEQMDHGPILLQQPVALSGTPILGRELDRRLSLLCGNLLTEVIRELPKGTLTPMAQKDAEATFCTKITKAMAELTLDPHALPTGEEAFALYRKICAFDGWPEAFFIYKGTRIKIKAAELLKEGGLTIRRIVPEGKSEMDFAAYFAP